MYHIGKKYFLFCFAILAVSQDSSAQYLGCSKIEQIPRTECESLERIFEEANGRIWRNNRGWLRSNQPCNWFGITCTSTSWPRNVIRLNLSSNDLTGSIPGEISQLTELRELIIHNRAAGTGALFGQLRGTLSSVLSDLSNLEVLWLSNNRIGGSLPAEYSRMSKLKLLLLDQNEFTGPIPESYGDLDLLEEIDFSGNQLAGEIPDEFVRLGRLRELVLSSNLLFGPIPDQLGNLEALRKLELDSNNLTGPVPASLTSLKRLVSLRLEGNQLESPISQSQAREFSEIANCNLIQGPATSSQKALCFPGFIDGSSEQSLCGLDSSADCSSCSGINFDDSQCLALESIYTASRGDSWSNKDGWLSNTDPCSWFGLSCENDQVTEIDLSQNGLRGSLPGDLNSISNLRELNLSENLLAGPIPEDLGALANIEFLDLSENQLTGVLALPIVDLASRTDTCNLQGNDGSLCFPTAPPYDQFPSQICGLMARPSCQPQILSSIEQFEAQQLGQRLILSWQVDVGSEELDYRVEQERAGDFVEIGLVGGSSGQEYQFILTNPQIGQTRFRIQILDASGSIKDGPVLDVVFIPSHFLIQGPFPNPAIQRSSIRIAIKERAVIKLELFDLVGKKIRTLFENPLEEGREELLDIDLRGLSSGLYFLKIGNGSESVTLPLHILK